MSLKKTKIQNQIYFQCGLGDFRGFEKISRTIDWWVMELQSSIPSKPKKTALSVLFSDASRQKFWKKNRHLQIWMQFLPV